MKKTKVRKAKRALTKAATTKASTTRKGASTKEAKTRSVAKTSGNIRSNPSYKKGIANAEVKGIRIGFEAAKSGVSLTEFLSGLKGKPKGKRQTEANA